jgi:serine/threonine protein kinase
MTTPHQPACCSNDQLHDLLIGSVSNADSDAWLQHLEQCPACQTKLHALAGEDGDWSQAREVLSASNDGKHVARSQEWAESLSRKLLSPPSHPEMLGRIGRYDIERLLGAGGMGIVFKGFDTELHRTVAIKVLAPSLAFHGSARHRFAKEARAAAAVVHEDVVPIYDVDADREVPYLVMRYIPGESLQARIDRVGPLELKQILRIGKQVTAGLAAAHAQGLIHRDVKPANVLLEEGIDRALLTDFGLAQAIDDANATASGVLPGTPQYMSLSKRAARN